MCDLIDLIDAAICTSPAMLDKIWNDEDYERRLLRTITNGIVNVGEEQGEICFRDARDLLVKYMENHDYMYVFRLFEDLDDTDLSVDKKIVLELAAVGVNIFAKDDVDTKPALRF